LLSAIFKKLFGKRPGAGAAESGGVEKAEPELLVFGLGNPEDKYDGTRHNIGFDVVDGLCALSVVGASAEVCCQAVCRPAICGAGRKPALLVKPLTYMNLSGDAVAGLARKYKLSAAGCLVIVDDFNIPLGKIRFRKDGSAGGHNGLKSVSAAIGPSYPRLRVGIGPLPAGVSVINFVLGQFDKSEREEVKKVVKAAAEAVVFMIDNGIDAAMNKYN
jgi:PTH1 family peptidyl-tRNA hydrolase